MIIITKHIYIALFFEINQSAVLHIYYAFLYIENKFATQLWKYIFFIYATLHLHKTIIQKCVHELLCFTLYI